MPLARRDSGHRLNVQVRGKLLKRHHRKRRSEFVFEKLAHVTANIHRGENDWTLRGGRQVTALVLHCLHDFLSDIGLEREVRTRRRALDGSANGVFDLRVEQVHHQRIGAARVFV